MAYTFEDVQKLYPNLVLYPGATGTNVPRPTAVSAPAAPVAPATPATGGALAATSPFNYTGELIPNANALNTALSSQIASLLNPTGFFGDTSRQAAELAAGRGIPGSDAAYGTALRMTDEEKLKRIALGEQLMSSAYGRMTPLTITPTQGAGLSLEAQRLAQAQAWQDFQKQMETMSMLLKRQQVDASTRSVATPTRGGYSEHSIYDTGFRF